MDPKTELHTYKVHRTRKKGVEAQHVEFEAHGADIALGLTAEICGDEPVTLYEDGNKIADLRRTRGVWRVEPSKRG